MKEHRVKAGGRPYTLQRKEVYPCPLFSVLLSAPCRNLANQVKGQRSVIRELNRSFTGFVPLQPIRKSFHCLRTGVQSDVIFGCRKLNEILFFPVSGHTPGNLLDCVRQCAAYDFVDLPEIQLGIFRLLCNVFLNVLRCCAAIMMLICILELPSAFGAVPHDFPPPLWLNRFYRDSYGISRLFSYFCPNLFPNTNDIANGTVCIFYSHIHNAARIRLAVKGDFCL